MFVYHPQQQQLYNELQTENIDLVMNTDKETLMDGSGDNARSIRFPGLRKPAGQ